MLISPPGTTAVDEQDGKGKITGVNGGWRNFFSAVYNICNALTMSGTTANRPSAGLWVGRMYFDTTLGKPIWFKSPGWVDAAGGAV
jgi:hypothetical protein